MNLKGKIDKLDPSKLVVNAMELARNNYHGVVINRSLYNRIFKQDYNLEALRLLASQGYYPDSLSKQQNWSL